MSSALAAETAHEEALLAQCGALVELCKNADEPGRSGP